MNNTVLKLFEGYGVELEYAIVDRETLSVLPVTDRLIHSIAGSYESEIERGDLCWSNELVLHVVELKTNGPAKSLSGLSELFHTHVREINRRLESLGGRLMPTAMHPWMNPERETRLWPHEHNAIYEAFHRIFDCRGHGWSNLQSAHLNLPFANDEEFGRLHSAVRLILPLIPALAASSPLVENRRTEYLDTRMEFYRTNARNIPSVTGLVIPEPVYTRRDYETRILKKMYEDIAPHDPNGILQHEWLNARGAIARFDRNTIEIRTIDVQECPTADLAIVYAVRSALQELIFEKWSTVEEQQNASTEKLAAIFLESIHKGENTVIQDGEYLRLFGLNDGKSYSIKEIWTCILDRLPHSGHSLLSPIRTILREGSLSSRILKRLGDDCSPKAVFSVYQELCDCLDHDRLFVP